MLYTGDFVLRYYVGFSQIRSHMCMDVCTLAVSIAAVSGHPDYPCHLGHFLSGLSGSNPGILVYLTETHTL